MHICTYYTYYILCKYKYIYIMTSETSIASNHETSCPVVIPSVVTNPAPEIRRP